MRRELVIGSPKQSSSAFKGWQGFFPYYAGYPTEFAESLLYSAGLGQDATVFDPWNGSGTTTFAASRLGIPSIGIDLNAVMIIVARARLLSPLEATSLKPLAIELLSHTGSEGSIEEPSDPLHQWFEKNTASEIRAVELVIRRSLLGAESSSGQSAGFSDISPLGAAFYVALFNAARVFAAPFQASNPTWLRIPKSDETKVSLRAGDFQSRFLATVDEMAQALKVRAGAEPITEFVDSETFVGDSTSFKLPGQSVDLVLSSPPYCTRLDYTAATRIELALLAPTLRVDPSDLSRRMIGTTKVPLADKSASNDWGSTCLEFLDAVERHPSKASSGYYLKTHLDYFDKMDRSIKRIAKALKDGGRMILVVQDSFYKEVHNDLPVIISEMAHKRGLRLSRRENFFAKRSMSRIHPGRRNYRKKSAAVEAVLCFEK